jgi:2-polyprenyl-3-methyl-5-hydroxy-6-metoxy-1,4-benzoquinol methylase
MRFSYEKLYGEQQMLHYPLHLNGNESLLQGQANLTDYCLSHFRDLDAMRLLDIGCGNGIQTLYISEKYRPQFLYGVDLNPMHVDMANQEKARRGLAMVEFGVDNAQSLTSVANNSFDAAICIESSHHYPDKFAFLSQVKRVLRPGGQFVIADLIRKDDCDPTALEKKLYLFHWHPQQYRDAVSRLQMALVKEEDITNLILPAFHSTDHWLEQSDGVSASAHRLGRTLGRTLIALYKLQIERYFRYYLMMGRRD